MSKYFVELRNKFLLIVITFFSTASVCYFYKASLLFLFTQMHLADNDLYFIFTDVTELFYIYFKLILFISGQITLWYLIYHVFSFISIALYFKEFKFLAFLFKSGTFFWLFSCILTSFVLLPISWNFFLTFQTLQGVYFEARITEYLAFYSNIYFATVVYCQFFTLIFLVLSDVQAKGNYIKKYRKLYYYFFLIFSTLLTPPDLLSQLLTTSVVVLTYEVVLFVLISKFWANKFS